MPLLRKEWKQLIDSVKISQEKSSSLNADRPHNLLAIKMSLQGTNIEKKFKESKMTVSKNIF